jgi:hypothetical protein
MSAVMTPRRERRGRRTRPLPAPGGQPALFGAGAPPAVPPAEPGAEPVAAGPAEALEPGVAVPVTPGAPEPTTTVPAAEPAATARAHRHGPTLDDLVAGAWEGLLAGAPADCFVCGTPLTPRHSAGAGIVGGRCGGCGTTVS